MANSQPPIAKSLIYPLTLALLLLAFWLRLENLDTLPTGLSNDEATSALDAFHLSRTGNFPMYEDHGRPEPLDRIVMAVGALFYGSSVWAYRLTNVFAGLFTVALAYWAARQALYDLKSPYREVGALAAAAALTVAISHITLSRAIYRAIFQPPFMLLFIGLLLCGLRTYRHRDFVFSGVGLALVLYSYTAALAVPLALAPVALSLFIFRRKTWRQWLPNLVILGIVVAVLMLPVGWRLVTNPEAVLGRSSEVNRGFGANLTPIAINGVIAQFFTRGDINPQYNVEQVPLLPRSFVALFVIGLIGLLLRLRQPSSWLISSLLVLCTVPVIAGSEVPHGLRIMGEFAVFPLVIGTGLPAILIAVQWLVERLQPQYIVSLRTAIAVIAAFLLIVITYSDAVVARRIYTVFWSRSDGYEHTWSIHERVLPIAEWFFRPDQRDFARWLAAQDAPMLVPTEALTIQTTRAWLMTDYPNVVAVAEAEIPADTMLVVPWSLELDDLMRSTRHYALLDGDTITLLPPLSVETHATLLADIEDAEPIIRNEGDLNFLGYFKPLINHPSIVFEREITAQNAILGEEVQIVGWRGPDTLPDAGIATYTLDWTALRRIGHEYSAFLQLQTQDYQRIAGDDVHVWRWLFPSTIWRTSDLVPDVHRLEIPDDLQPGAYRLVAGMYVATFVDERIPAAGDDVQNDMATIGWVKVPQPEIPSLDAATLTLDATIDDKFALRGATAEDNGQLDISLYWESLDDRPDVDATIFVHVVNSSGEIVAQQDARPWAGQYPTFIWDRGEIVQTDYMLDIGNADLNDLSLRVGMYTFPDLVRLPVMQAGNTGDVVELGNLANWTQSTWTIPRVVITSNLLGSHGTGTNE